MRATTLISPGRMEDELDRTAGDEYWRKGLGRGCVGVGGLTLWMNEWVIAYCKFVWHRINTFS